MLFNSTLTKHSHCAELRKHGVLNAVQAGISQRISRPCCAASDLSILKQNYDEVCHPARTLDRAKRKRATPACTFGQIRKREQDLLGMMSGVSEYNTLGKYSVHHPSFEVCGLSESWLAS